MNQEEQMQLQQQIQQLELPYQTEMKQYISKQCNQQHLLNSESGVWMQMPGFYSIEREW